MAFASELFILDCTAVCIAVSFTSVALSSSRASCLVNLGSF